jgi:putative transposase
MKTFFGQRDFQYYLGLLAEWPAKYKVDIWCYCLMSNHVHLIAVPSDEGGLRKAMEEIHRRYTRYLHFRKGWRGHLWQGRFSSFPMDEEHVMKAARYIERNPVDAGIVKEPQEYRWSSVHAHLEGKNTRFVNVRPLLERADTWMSYLETPVSEKETNRIRLHERTHRPLGNDQFLRNLEKQTGRTFLLRKPGRKPSNRVS